MTACINKMFVKIHTAGELFFLLAFWADRKEAETEKASVEQ